jgi:hypothetical protein
LSGIRAGTGIASLGFVQFHTAFPITSTSNHRFGLPSPFEAIHSEFFGHGNQTAHFSVLFTITINQIKTIFPEPFNRDSDSCICQNSLCRLFCVFHVTAMGHIREWIKVRKCDSTIVRWSDWKLRFPRLPFIEIAGVWIRDCKQPPFVILRDSVDGTFASKFSSFRRGFCIHWVPCHVHHQPISILGMICLKRYLVGNW